MRLAAILTGLLLVTGSLPAADPVARSPAAGLDAGVQATWTRLPLRHWAERAAALAGQPVVIDRRIDPDTPITLTAGGEPLRELLATVAAAAGATPEELASSVRIVPTAAAGQASRADRDRELRLQRLPAGPRGVARARRPWQWPAGARPRDLVAAAAAEAGIEIVGLDAIPHDHFPAADLPPLSLAERLDLVLAHFDRRVVWQAIGGRATGRIVPIDAEILAAPPPKAADRRTPQLPARRAVTLVDEFTLRLEAPLDQALAALCGRMGLALDLDLAGLAARGIAPGEIVRVELEKATQAELLDAVLQPVGLAWKIEGERLLVFPVASAPSP